MTCKRHPKYKAIRKPGCLCVTCWFIYFSKTNFSRKEEQAILADLKME
jgi:hypothetical protein